MTFYTEAFRAHMVRKMLPPNPITANALSAVPRLDALPAPHAGREPDGARVLRAQGRVRAHEARIFGIVLRSEKNDAMLKNTQPENNEHILSTHYQMYLPTEEELRAELARAREVAERARGCGARATARGGREGSR